MKRIITMFVLLAIGAGLSAQQNRHSNYIGIELGAGINNLGHNADNGAFYVGWGFQGGLRYAHFFGEHFGMGLGVQASRIFADDRVPQRKMMSYLNIPVKFYWRTPVCEKWAFLFGLGGSVDMPLLGSDSMTKKIGASLVVDLGFNYELCDHWGLYMGLYGGYSFTDMYEGDIQIKDLRLLNAGLKLGVNLGWDCHSADKGTKSGDSELTSYDNASSAFGNNNDEEAEAAAREARCNARRMNNPDMAQAVKDVDNDIAEAEQMANAAGNNAALEAVADAKAKVADARKAYRNGQYCKAYDLFNEAYGYLADSYADDAASYAESLKNDDAAKAAADADIYAEAAHRDGLDCAMAAMRNARINAEIARDADGTGRTDVAFDDPNYADYLAGEALAMAEEADCKSARIAAKDASGKAYRGNLGDSYAASAKSFADCAAVYAAKSNDDEAKVSAEEAQNYAGEAAEAARMGDVAGAYRAARAAQQAAERARRLANGDVAHNTAADKPAATSKPADPAQLQKHIDQINATVHFDFNSTKPKYDSKTDVALRALCAIMKADSNVKVLIVGHTDNVGSPKSNMSCGKKRAEALKRVMVGMGAPASAIATASRGQEEPVVANDTDEHRLQNRRVVITLR